MQFDFSISEDTHFAYISETILLKKANYAYLHIVKQ